METKPLKDLGRSNRQLHINKVYLILYKVGYFKTQDEENPHAVIINKLFEND